MKRNKKSKHRGIRKTKACKQKTTWRKHQRKVLDKLARNGVPSVTVELVRMERRSKDKMAFEYKVNEALKFEYRVTLDGPAFSNFTTLCTHAYDLDKVVRIALFNGIVPKVEIVPLEPPCSTGGKGRIK